MSYGRIGIVLILAIFLLIAAGCAYGTSLFTSEVATTPTPAPTLNSTPPPTLSSTPPLDATPITTATPTPTPQLVVEDNPFSKAPEPHHESSAPGVLITGPQYPTPVVARITQEVNVLTEVAVPDSMEADPNSIETVNTDLTVNQQADPPAITKPTGGDESSQHFFYSWRASPELTGEVHFPTPAPRPVFILNGEPTISLNTSAALRLAEIHNIVLVDDEEPWDEFTAGMLYEVIRRLPSNRSFGSEDGLWKVSLTNALLPDDLEVTRYLQKVCKQSGGVPSL